MTRVCILTQASKSATYSTGYCSATIYIDPHLSTSDTNYDPIALAEVNVGKTISAIMSADYCYDVSDVIDPRNLTPSSEFSKRLNNPSFIYTPKCNLRKLR